MTGPCTFTVLSAELTTSWKCTMAVNREQLLLCKFVVGLQWDLIEIHAHVQFVHSPCVKPFDNVISVTAFMSSATVYIVHLTPTCARLFV